MSPCPTFRESTTFPCPMFKMVSNQTWCLTHRLLGLTPLIFFLCLFSCAFRCPVHCCGLCDNVVVVAVHGRGGNLQWDWRHVYMHCWGSLHMQRCWHHLHLWRSVLMQLHWVGGYVQTLRWCELHSGHHCNVFVGTRPPRRRLRFCGRLQ